MPLDPEALADMVIQAIETALAPVVERLASAEARLSMLGDLRDRVVTVETKAARPDLGDVPDRVVKLEARAVGPTADVLTAAIGGLRDRVDSLEGLVKDAAALRERLAVLETRAPVPGPPGADGVDGKDGVDGLGFDDLAVEFDGDRTIALKFARGETTKVWPIVLPFQKYQGVYQQGKAYEVGDTVTWASQLWHCHEATITPPGDGSKHWQLCVRKGRDGKDGRDGRDAVPVVSLRGAP